MRNKKEIEALRGRLDTLTNQLNQVLNDHSAALKSLNERLTEVASACAEEEDLKHLLQRVEDLTQKVNGLPAHRTTSELARELTRKVMGREDQ